MWVVDMNGVKIGTNSGRTNHYLFHTPEQIYKNASWTDRGSHLT
jgi:hypothetical protein